MMSRPSLLVSDVATTESCRDLSSLYLMSRLSGLCSGCRDLSPVVTDVATTKSCRDLLFLYVMSRQRADVTTTVLCKLMSRQWADVATLVSTVTDVATTF